ncbi:MAG: D-alanyl-D-alanine carboxypeptidase family protein [Clostridia bacterium]
MIVVNKKKYFNLFVIIVVVIIYCMYSKTYIYGEALNKEFVDISSPSAVVIDCDSNRVLYEKNAEEKRKMASLTKIMTAIMLVENCEMDELIEVPTDATWIGGSEVGLKKGDKVSAKSLLYGMLLPSGNDCAYTVGIHIGGTIQNFAYMMNEKAKQIGVSDTNFTNPHGLDEQLHYTTAKAMAQIMRYALKNKDINEAVNTKTATINFGSFSKQLTNTNALLTTYEKADGGKTGFTNGANRCLIASASDTNRRFIAVILGAQNTKERFGDAKTILEECFRKYTKTDISKYLNFYINIPVEKGNIDNYERQISEEFTVALSKEEYEKIYIKQDIVQNIVPPMRASTKLGTINVYIDEEKIIGKDIYLEENIYEKTINDYMRQILEDMFKDKYEGL